MIRMFARLIVSIAANAVGLLAAAMILDSFSINGVSFVIAVAIFSLVTTILGPLVTKIALQNAPYLMGGIALVTTFVGLLVTNIISSGISIHGPGTWLLATLIIWLFSLIANLVLPLLIFKEVLSKHRATNQN